MTVNPNDGKFLTHQDGLDIVTALTNISGNATKIGNLANLETTAKTDLVSAINEVDAESANEDIIANEFSALSTYAKGAYVMHDGTLYVCSTAVTSAGAWNAANWTAIQVGEKLPALAEKSNLTSIFETGTTASQAITSGTYFYLDGDLVRAKADIASGATFTSDTNYEAVTAGGLNELNNKICYEKIYEDRTANSSSDFFKCDTSFTLTKTTLLFFSLWWQSASPSEIRIAESTATNATYTHQVAFTTSAVQFLDGFTILGAGTYTPWLKLQTSGNGDTLRIYKVLEI